MGLVRPHPLGKRDKSGNLNTRAYHFQEKLGLEETTLGVRIGRISFFVEYQINGDINFLRNSYPQVTRHSDRRVICELDSEAAFD